MLKLDMDINGRLILKMEVVSPAVYLDLCALMNLAEDNILGNKFRTILNQRKGTLLIASLHLVELSDVLDAKKIGLYELFLDSLLDHLGFIDVAPNRVIKKENRRLMGDKNINPPGDEQLLDFFSEKMLSIQTIEPLTFRGFLAKFVRSDIADKKKKFHLQFNPDIEQLRKEKQKAKNYFAKINKVPQDMNRGALTKYIYYDIFSSLICENKDYSSNGWRDFYHTVVPLAYCDYLVLDKEFAHKAKTTVNRLRRNKYIVQTAEVFSVGKIGEFLDTFNI